MSTKRRGGSRRGRGRSRRPAFLARNPEPVFINPPRRPSRARRAATAARGWLGSSGITGAVQSQLPMLAGALAAKIAQKKFGDKTAEDGNWTWKDYLAGAIGALVVSQGSRMLFKANPATSQKMLEGGLLIIGFKILTQELVPMSDTAKEWLGQDADEGSWQGQDADSAEGSGYYGIGDLYEAPNGQLYVYNGEEWAPADDANRALPAYQGEELSPPGQYGEELSPPGQYGEELSPPGQYGADPYVEAYR